MIDQHRDIKMPYKHHFRRPNVNNIGRELGWESSQVYSQIVDLSSEIIHSFILKYESVHECKLLTSGKFKLKMTAIL